MENTTPNTSYLYLVNAFNVVGTSSFGPLDTEVTPAATSPAAPSNSQAQILTVASTNAKPNGKGGGSKGEVFDKVSLSWTDNASNEGGYSLEQCLVKGKGKNSSCDFTGLVISLPADSIGSDDSSPVSGNKYRYRVKATSINANDSGFSSTIEVKIP